MYVTNTSVLMCCFSYMRRIHYIWVLIFKSVSQWKGMFQRHIVVYFSFFRTFNHYCTTILKFLLLIFLLQRLFNADRITSKRTFVIILADHTGVTSHKKLLVSNLMAVMDIVGAVPRVKHACTPCSRAPQHLKRVWWNWLKKQKPISIHNIRLEGMVWTEADELVLMP